MKKFMVTAMFEGKLESWECYGNSVSHVKKYITDHWNEQLIYGNVQDLVIPFDKYNQEIFVGDELYVASKNAVRRVTVTKIAPKATFSSYGILIRKLTVKDLDDGQTLVINESRDTVKINVEQAK